MSRERKIARIRSWIRSLSDELKDVERAIADDSCMADLMLDDLYEALLPHWTDDTGEPTDRF